MKHVLTLLVMLTLLGCSKDEPEVANSSELNEKWVDVETRMDTLSFENLDDLKVMNLSREQEIVNGQSQPKSGSGPYKYEVSDLNISLNWMLSSNANFNNYYFEIIQDKLIIGNFYGSESGERLTFEKLE